MKPEENKYYTPDISEFFVGFECEKQSQELIGQAIDDRINAQIIFGDDYNPKETNMFVAHIISSNDIWFYGLNTHIIKNDFRVKHLDKDDIESFGFNVVSKDESAIEFEYNDYEYILYLIGDSLILKYVVYNDGKKIECDTKFDGNIKNKSELKKLLAQIEIL